MFKSGFIGIVGRPNVGKSTLLNFIMGEKIAITTNKPQTTRNRIMGIKNLTGAQMVFLDTPGIHKTTTPLNRLMVQAAEETFGNSDLLVMLMEANAGIQPGDIYTISHFEKAKLPVILAINKIDLVDQKDLLPLMDECRGLYHFVSIVPLSALTGEGVSSLLDSILAILPEGPSFFPEDMITDRSERFIAAEMIREKIILLTHQEIPYATAVIVDSFKEDADRNLIRIQATIHVEKDSQKGIIIGKKGAMLKRIGTEARFDMEKFFLSRIYLELFVRVQKDWTHSKKMLEEFGYARRQQ